MKLQHFCAFVIYFWTISSVSSYLMEKLNESSILETTGICQRIEEEYPAHPVEVEEYQYNHFGTYDEDSDFHKLYGITTPKMVLPSGEKTLCKGVYLFKTSPISNCILCQKLIYQDSQIHTIETNLMTEPNLIEEIDMAKTGIQKIESGAFANLPILKVLNLDMNHLNKIGKGTFNSLRSLISLNLSHNVIHEIEDESFHGSLSIEILDLSYNKINVLPPGLFLHLNLISLNISNNLLANIGEIFCGSIPKVTSLKLDNNLLDSIPTCLDFQMISELSLSFNSITDFNSTFLPITLETFDISNNNLRHIDENSFRAFSLLQRIDISVNKLETLEANCFKSLDNLRTLIITGINLRNIKPELFMFLKPLTELRLAKNYISLLENRTFQYLPNLELLDLSENNLDYIALDVLRDLESLQVLNISHNNIEYLQSGIFNGMKKIKNIDLSFNNLNLLQPHIFEPLLELNALDIKFNHINTLEIQTLSEFCPELKSLAIAGNNFSCIALGELFSSVKYRNMHLESGETFSTQNIRGISCYESMENVEQLNEEENKTNIMSFFEYDFEKTSFYNFFKNFVKREPQDDRDQNKDSVYEFLHKNFTHHLSEDLNVNVKEFLKFENTFFQNFSKELSAIASRLDSRKDLNVSLNDVSSSLRDDMKTFMTFEQSSFLNSISKEFEKMANNKNYGELIPELKKNQQIITADKLVQTGEAKRTEELINAINQFKFFFILCTFIVSLVIIAMTIFHHVKKKYMRANSEEQVYELPILS